MIEEGFAEPKDEISNLICSNIICSCLLTLPIVQNLVWSNQLNVSHFVIQCQLLPSHSPQIPCRPSKCVPSERLRLVKRFISHRLHTGAWGNLVLLTYLFVSFVPVIWLGDGCIQRRQMAPRTPLVRSNDWRWVCRANNGVSNLICACKMIADEFATHEVEASNVFVGRFQ